MRNIHELEIEQEVFDDVVKNINQLLVLKKDEYQKDDYVLLRKSILGDVTEDSQLIMITSIIEDENIKDGYAIMKIRNI